MPFNAARVPISPLKLKPSSNMLAEETEEVSSEVASSWSSFSRTKTKAIELEPRVAVLAEAGRCIERLADGSAYSPSGTILDLLDMIPEIFSDDYYAKVTTAIKRVDGMSLSNMLSGCVCNPLIKDVFAADLAPLSMTLVADVRQCMQEVLGELCDRLCGDFPALLRAMKSTLVESFMSEMEVKTEEVVAKVCQAELNWSFTQNPVYLVTLQNAKKAARFVRDGEASSSGVGRIPKEFIEILSGEDEDTVHDLQVLLCIYVDIVSTSICDTIPKLIHTLLVHGTIAGFVDSIIQNICPEDLESLLAEGSNSQRMSRNLKRRLAQYEEGVKIISNTRFSA